MLTGFYIVILLAATLVQPILRWLERLIGLIPELLVVIKIILRCWHSRALNSIN